MKLNRTDLVILWLGVFWTLFVILKFGPLQERYAAANLIIVLFFGWLPMGIVTRRFWKS